MKTLLLYYYFTNPIELPSTYRTMGNFFMMILQIVCYTYHSIISLNIIPYLYLNIKCLFVKPYMTICINIYIYIFDIFYFRFDYDIE